MSIDSERLIFLSLKPRFAEAIVSGEKLIELRRQRPNLDLPTRALLYASSPAMALVGECVVTGVVDLAPSTMWRRYGSVSGVTRTEFAEYFLGKKRTYGLLLDKPSRLRTPVPLQQLRDQFGTFQPPQSFRYFAPADFSAHTV